MSAAKKHVEWGKTGTVVAYAEWLRSRSGALCVMVVRRDDATLAADEQLAPADARMLIEDRVIALAADLELARKEKRKGARLVRDELREQQGPGFRGQ
jgi:hypothetical protein